MIIHEPEIILADGEVTIRARIETKKPVSGWPEFLWFKYPEQYQHGISDRADPFLGSLILVAMTAGEDLECRGILSPRLLYAMDEYQQIYSKWLPDVFTPVHIHSTSLLPVPPLENPGQYATAFSGGVDSFFTLKQSIFPDPGKPAWSVHYGLFILGFPDIPLIYSKKFDVFARQYTGFFDELGLELIPVRTNLMQFAAYRIAFNPFLEAPIIGSALGLSPLLSGVLIPSGWHYHRYRASATGPITAHLLSTETFEPFASGVAFTRLQKVQAIADWAPAQKYLRVCPGSNSEGFEMNCSHCAKCIRTRMDLYMLGKLGQISTFEHSFSLKDFLLWGRWMEIGYGFEIDTLKFAIKNRKTLVPLVLVGLLIGYARCLLRRFLPMWLKRQIFKFTSKGNPHRLYVQNPDSKEA